MDDRKGFGRMLCSYLKVLAGGCWMRQLVGLIRDFGMSCKEMKIMLIGKDRLVWELYKGLVLGQFARLF